MANIENLFCCLVVFVSVVGAVEFNLEAEYLSNPTVRPSASGGLTTILQKGQYLKIPFCLRADGILNIHPRVIGTENIKLKVDGKSIPSESSVTDRPRISTGDDICLSRGRHILTITSDAVDIEIDNILFNVEDNQLTDEQFQCQMFCLPEIPKHDAFPVTSIPSAKIVQRSFDGKCAESKNVIVDFYHETVKKFRITAQNPSYRSLLNSRKADRDNCPVLKPIIWEFRNIKLAPKMVEESNTVLEIKKGEEGCFTMTSYFNITQDLHDINVPAIGGSLELKIKNHKSDVNVQIKFQVGNREISSQRATINLGQNKILIPIPDNTWSKFNNEVEILACDDASDFEITAMTLSRRELKKEQGETIYDDGEFVVERVIHDMWWMGNPGMQVTVTGSDTSTYAHYIRIYKKVPWGGFSQNFVIYQDGNIRLLPPTTHGTDWIPFGTFILTGRFDPNSQKMSSEITKIVINPETSELDVTYADGSVWLYELKVGFEKMEVDVTLRTPVELSTLPFLQVRSMYVEDGKSNVDRLSVDGMPEHGILDNWASLYGSSFLFYRGCISEYHTQSPDTHIQLLE